MKKRRLFLTCVMSTLLGIMVMGCSSKQSTVVTEPTEITTSVAESAEAANEEKTETTTAVETETTTEEETETTTVVETEAPTVVETEAPTVVETEAPAVRVSEDGTYVTKTITLWLRKDYRAYDKSIDLKIYALGGNTRWVWDCWGLQDDTTAEEWAAEVGVSLSDINFVTRTDFADGLIDNDGNGIDDRDPINGMGFIDLNYNGVDDRQVIMGEYHKVQYDESFEIITDAVVCGGNNALDYKEKTFETTRWFPFNGVSYLCPHNVVCSSANLYYGYVWASTTLPSFYVDKERICLDVICPICNSEAYAWKNDVGDRLLRDAERVSECLGYEIGSTLTLTDGTFLTYQGNDIWLSDSGYDWLAVFCNLNHGGSYEEICSSRSIWFWRNGKHKD